MMMFVHVVVAVENIIKIVEFANGFHELELEFQSSLKTINFGNFQNSVFRISAKYKISYFIESVSYLKKPYKTDLLYFLRNGKIQGDIFTLLG